MERWQQVQCKENKKRKIQAMSRKSVGYVSFWSFVLKEVTARLIKTKIDTALLKQWMILAEMGDHI